MYVKRFHEKALDCRDQVNEKVLVHFCLQGVDNEYHVFLGNLSFPSFSKLREEVDKVCEKEPNLVE